MVRAIAIVPLRMDSRRLPSKHLKPLAGRPLIETLVARLGQARRLDRIVLATTTRACDDALVEAAAGLGLPCHRGAVEDVLGRCTAAALAEAADLVVKANGDSPLLAAEIIDSALDQIVLQDADCVTGKNGYTGLPVGLGPEVLTAAALARLDREITTAEHRESITGAVFQEGSGFAWAPAITPLEWRAPELDLCVDTTEDLARLEAILDLLPPSPAADWAVPEILAAARSVAAAEVAASDSEAREAYA
jgi:spore coat polysaccharide biosynthesis protein SpsF